MRLFRYILPVLLLASCEQLQQSASGGDHVNVDGYNIDVSYLGGSVFTASGGEQTHDKWVKYRQIRAVEVVSLCREKDANYRGGTLTVHVGCAHPRTHLS